MNKLLILSAGHGSGDPGACANGQEEHYWNVQICNRVKIYCDGWGMPCDYRPTESGNLSQQIQDVNNNYGSFDDGYALQVHLNAGGGTGCEFWTPSRTTDTTNIGMANSILSNVIEQTGLKNRGVKDASTNHWGKLGWTDDTNTAAGLIESWFIDVDASNEERANNVAYGIALGVCKFFGHYTGGKMLSSAEQAKLDAQKAAEADRQAQINAQIEAERQAQAEKARLEAIAEAERVAKAKAEQERIAKEKADAEALRKAKEQDIIDKQVANDELAKKEADKKVAETNQTQIDTENLNILQIILKALKDFITAILAKKG